MIVKSEQDCSIELFGNIKAKIVAETKKLQKSCPLEKKNDFKEIRCFRFDLKCHQNALRRIETILRRIKEKFQGSSMPSIQ